MKKQNPICIAPKDIKPIPVFRASLAAIELASILKTFGRPIRMLDIGGGHGIHADYFRHVVPDIQVDILDLEEQEEPLVFCGDFLDFEPERPYDVIWTSHVLEHVRNTGLFLDKIYDSLADDGIVAVTVPPHINDLGILAHLTTWDPMLLIINLVHARFDCRQGRFARYRYNISGIAHKAQNSTPSNLKSLLPDLKWVGYRMSGQFKFLNWANKTLEGPTMQAFDTIDQSIASLSEEKNAKPRFFSITKKPDAGKYYFDPKRRWILSAN